MTKALPPIDTALLYRACKRARRLIAAIKLLNHDLDCIGGIPGIDETGAQAILRDLNRKVLGQI